MENPKTTEKKESHTKTVVTNPSMRLVHPGLEPFMYMNRIIVVQELEFLEIFLGLHMNNRYSVYNQFNQRIFYVGENSECCDRYCFGQSRPFLINAYDSLGRPVLTFTRNCNCTMACWGNHIGGSLVEVHLVTTGQKIGSIVQQCNCCTPKFFIKNENDEVIMNIMGPSASSFCSCLFCCNPVFTIREGDDFTNGQVVGIIQKYFGFQQFFSAANTFGIQFQFEILPIHKALVMASVFTIDFSFFENVGESGNRHGRGGGCSICNAVVCLIIVGLFVGFIIFLFLRFRSNWNSHSSHRPIG